MSIPSLRAGVARHDITPEIGTPLFGYPNQRTAQSVDDGLNATALVLQSDECTACIISLDWCLVDEPEATLLCKAIFEATDIAPENITVHATHTHSGPITMECWGWGKPDAAYLDFVRPRIVEAVSEACTTLTPVRVGIGKTQTDIGVNRREVRLDGSIGLGFNPWGPYDPELTVLRFERTEIVPDTEGTSTLASLVHVGAHPTSRGSDPAISRDWPGVMMDRVEQLTGAPVLFLNGAFGDVAPRTTIGGATGDGAKAAREVGLRAAFHAMRVWREIKEFRSLDLQTHSAEIALPFAPLPEHIEAEKQFAQYAGHENSKGAKEAEWRYWNAVLQAHQSPTQTARDWRQTITTLGPIAFVPFAGEVFSEITLRIKQASPFAYTLCLGTTNGSHGYYVTCDSRARGGYEVWVGKAYGAYLLAENIDDVLVQENVKLLQSLV